MAHWNVDFAALERRCRERGVAMARPSRLVRRTPAAAPALHNPADVICSRRLGRPALDPGAPVGVDFDPAYNPVQVRCPFPDFSAEGLRHGLPAAVSLLDGLLREVASPSPAPLAASFRPGFASARLRAGLSNCLCLKFPTLRLALPQGHTVYLHCTAGMGRSPGAAPAAPPWCLAAAGLLAAGAKPWSGSRPARLTRILRFQAWPYNTCTGARQRTSWRTWTLRTPTSPRAGRADPTRRQGVPSPAPEPCGALQMPARQRNRLPALRAVRLRTQALRNATCDMLWHLHSGSPGLPQPSTVGHPAWQGAPPPACQLLCRSHNMSKHQGVSPSRHRRDSNQRGGPQRDPAALAPLLPAGAGGASGAAGGGARHAAPPRAARP